MVKTGIFKLVKVFMILDVIRPSTAIFRLVLLVIFGKRHVQEKLLIYIKN